MSDNTKKQTRIHFITGYSGAGISSVLKSLEDMGYEVFDNFPLSLVDALIEDSDLKARPVAIGIDSRARGFNPDHVIDLVEHHAAHLTFLNCDPNILQRRFTETRRRHPLAQNKTVKHGIQQEHDLLSPLLNAAHLNLDTSRLSIHDLRHMLEGHFASNKKDKLSISILSFGFRNGVPREADLMMDVRFLKNPHWEKDLKEKTGKDKNVGNFIEEDPDFIKFFERFTNLLEILLPRYEKEGKTYLTIAVGCTGGRHRSVYTTIKLQNWMAQNGFESHVDHRDLIE